jgi:hypothetical protein
VLPLNTSDGLASSTMPQAAEAVLDGVAVLADGGLVVGDEVGVFVCTTVLVGGTGELVGGTGELVGVGLLVVDGVLVGATGVAVFVGVGVDVQAVVEVDVAAEVWVGVVVPVPVGVAVRGGVALLVLVGVDDSACVSVGVFVGCGGSVTWRLKAPLEAP